MENLGGKFEEILSKFCYMISSYVVVVSWFFGLVWIVIDYGFFKIYIVDWKILLVKYIVGFNKCNSEKN